MTSWHLDRNPPKIASQCVVDCVLLLHSTLRRRRRRRRRGGRGRGGRGRGSVGSCQSDILHCRGMYFLIFLRSVANAGGFDGEKITQVPEEESKWEWRREKEEERSEKWGEEKGEKRRESEPLDFVILKTVAFRTNRQMFRELKWKISLDQKISRQVPLSGFLPLFQYYSPNLTSTKLFPSGEYLSNVTKVHNIHAAQCLRWYQIMWVEIYIFKRESEEEREREKRRNRERATVIPQWKGLKCAIDWQTL